MKKNLFIAVLMLSLIVVCALTSCTVSTCADGHRWVDGEITSQATCDTAGSIIQKCSVCQKDRTHPVNAIGHAYGDWTDNGDGTHSRVCANDASHIETADHADVDSNLICDTCSAQLQASCQHVWSDWTDNGNGTCSRICTTDNSHVESGAHVDADTDELCDNCGANLHTCVWGEWSYDNDGTHSRVCTLDSNHVETDNCSGGNATCTENGLCSVCGGAYIPATDHDYPETWTYNGANHIKVCANGCGTDLTESHNHVESGRTPANCDSAEVITYTCVCGNDQTEYGAPATGHDTFVGYEVISGVLYWSDYCKNTVDDATGDHYCAYNAYNSQTGLRIALANQDTYDASNERDLKTLLENGFGAKLTENIVLNNAYTENGGANYAINITKGDLTLNLNGHSITGVNKTWDLDTYIVKCSVIRVQGSSTKLTIVGDGEISAECTDADYNVPIVVAEGAYVIIDSTATFHSTGDIVVYSALNACVDIYDGTFIADSTDENGAKRTLHAMTVLNAIDVYNALFNTEITFDDLSDEMLDGIVTSTGITRINVFGGKFVGFDPSNHTGNDNYSSKIVETYYHVLYDEESDTYSLEYHDFITNASDVLACSICNIHIEPVNEDITGTNEFTYVDNTGESVIFVHFVLEPVDGVDNVYYLKEKYSGLYFAYDSETGNEIMSFDKTNAISFTVVGNPNAFAVELYIAGTDELFTSIDTAYTRFYCENHIVESVVTPKTCETNGYTTNTCANCGRTTITDIVDAGHAYGDWTPDGNGSHWRICANDPSHIIYSEDFCYDGDGDYRCDVCNDCLHNYTHVVTEPTCTQPGYTTHTCSVCGNSYTDSETAVVSCVEVWEDQGNGYCMLMGCKYGTCGIYPGTGETEKHIDENHDCACDRCGAEVHVYSDYTNAVVNCGGTHTITCANPDCTKTKTENHTLSSESSIYCACGVTMIEKAYSVKATDVILIVFEDGEDMYFMDSQGRTSTETAIYYTVCDSGHGDLSYFLEFSEGFLSVEHEGAKSFGRTTEIDESVCLWAINIDENGFATITNVFYGVNNSLTIDDGGGKYSFVVAGPVNDYTYSIYKLVDHTAEKFNHQYVWTDNGDGTCSQVCSNNSEHTLPAEDHADENGDNICDNCGATIVVPEITATYSFVDKFGTYASSWNNSYTSRTLASTTLGSDLPTATFTLSNASKQTQTVTDRPTLASKGTVQYVTVAVTDKTIKSVTFDLQQWGTKTFNDIHIEYFDGTKWVTCSSVITTPGTLKSTELPDGVTEVRLSYYSSGTSSNKQLGLSAVTLTLI